MGGDLPPAKAKAPTFMVWAVKDPTSGNLDRIQIVKGWTKSGQSFEKIFDVVWAGDRKPDKWTGVVPPIGSTVDVENAHLHEHDRRRGAEDGVDRSGVRSEPARLLLCARARDPDAALDDDPGASSSASRRPTSCAATCRSAPGARRSGTRRAPRRARTPRPGMTVADLKKQGAVALNDAQLKALIVGEVDLAAEQRHRRQVPDHLRRLGQGRGAKPLTPSEPGYVTQRFPANQGQFQLRYVGRKSALPSLVGDAAEASYLGDIAAVLHQQRQDRHRARRHADRDHRLQDGRQVRRRAQQRVRLRQLRDHPGADRAEPAGRQRSGRVAMRRLLREPLRPLPAARRRAVRRLQLRAGVDATARRAVEARSG